MANTEILKDIAATLRDGKEGPSLPVREFLSWFDAQRRGYWIVKQIREELANARLQTVPDFESAYLDSLMAFVLVPDAGVDVPSSAPSIDILATAPVPTSSISMELATASVYADPTYRISKLAAANNSPVCVVPDATLEAVVTVMLTRDFSQLPVMTNERDVKGIVSWTSIGTRLALGKGGRNAREVMDVHQEIPADASLFQVIPLIERYQYVLIRGSENRITGIVTATDLSLQFQQLAEPFLLLGEIENHIRRIIDDKFSAVELAAVRDPADTARPVAGVADLTFGEYIRLLENPDRWVQFQGSLSWTDCGVSSSNDTSHDPRHPYHCRCVRAKATDSIRRDRCADYRGASCRVSALHRVQCRQRRCGIGNGSERIAESKHSAGSEDDSSAAAALQTNCAKIGEAPIVRRRWIHKRQTSARSAARHSIKPSHRRMSKGGCLAA